MGYLDYRKVSLLKSLFRFLEHFLSIHDVLSALIASAETHQLSKAWASVSVNNEPVPSLRLEPAMKSKWKVLNTRERE